MSARDVVPASKRDTPKQITIDRTSDVEREHVRGSVKALIKRARQINAMKKRKGFDWMKVYGRKTPKGAATSKKKSSSSSSSNTQIVDDDDEILMRSGEDVEFEGQPQEDIVPEDIASESDTEQPIEGEQQFGESETTELDTPAPDIPDTMPYVEPVEHVVASSAPVELPPEDVVDEGIFDDPVAVSRELLTPEQHQVFTDFATVMFHQFKHNQQLSRIFNEYGPRLRKKEPGDPTDMFDAWNNLITDIISASSVRLQQWVFELGIVLSKSIPNSDIALDVKMKFQQASFKNHIYSPEHLEPNVYDNISRFVGKLVDYFGEEPHAWKSSQHFVDRINTVAGKLLTFMDKKTAAILVEVRGISETIQLPNALNTYGPRSPYYALQIIKTGLKMLEEQRKADVPDPRMAILSQIYSYVVENFVTKEERKSYMDYWTIVVDDYYEVLFDKLAVLAEVFYSVQQTTSNESTMLSVTAGDIAKIFGNQLSEPARFALSQATKVSNLQEHTVWELLTKLRKELYTNTAQVRKMNVRAKELTTQLESKETVLQSLNQIRRDYVKLGTVASMFFGSTAVRAKTNKFRDAMIMVSKQGLMSLYGMIIVRLLFLYDSRAKTERHVSSSSASDDVAPSFETTADALIDELFKRVEPEHAIQRLNDLLHQFTLLLDKNNEEDVHFVQENINIVNAFQAKEYDRMQAIFVSSISRYVKQAVNMETVFGAVKRYVADRTSYLSEEFRKDFDQRWKTAFDEDGRVNVDTLKNLIDHLLDTVVNQEAQSAQIANEYKDVQAELQLLDTEIQETTAAAQTWTNRRDLLQKDINRLEVLVGDVAEQVSQVTDDRNALEVQAAAILRTSSAAAATSRLEQLEETIRAVDAKKKTLAQQLQDKGRALANARSEMMMIQVDTQTANDKLASIVERYTLKQNLLADVARRIDIILKDYDAPSLDNIVPLSIEWFENIKTSIDTFYSTKYEPLLREVETLREERDKLSADTNIAIMNYQQIEAQCKQLQRDHELLKKRHSELIFALTQLYQKHADPQEQVENVADALENLDKKLIIAANYENDARFFKKEFEAKQTQVRELLEAQAVTALEIATLKQKKKDTKATFSSLSGLNTSLYDNNRILTDTVEALRNDLSQAQNDIRVRQVEFETLRRELDDAKEEKERIEQSLATQTARIARLVTVEADDIDDTIASTIRELQRNREEIARLNESTTRLSAENQAVLDTRLNTQRQLEALQSELEETKREHEQKVQEQRQTLESLKDRYRDVDKKYADIVSRRENIQRLINTDVLAADKKSVRLRDLENQLATQEDQLQRAQETIEQQRRIIEQTQVALKMAQAAQTQISRQTNMNPVELNNMQNLIGVVAREQTPSKEALRTLSGYLKKVPVHVDVKNVDEVIHAARSTAEEELIENVDGIQATYRSIVRTATSLSENRRPLMETTQRPTPQRNTMAATDDYEEDEDVPTFTRTESSQPSRVAITNAFTPTSHPDITALIEVDDGYASFSEVMDIVAKEVGEFPIQVIDQFYSFTESVRGRVAAPKSFWLKEHLGMKALVAHAMDASEQVRHTVFPISSTKQYSAFHAAIYDFYADMLKRNTPRDREEYNVGLFIDRIVSKLEAQWPNVRFTIEDEESIEGITFDRNNSRNFLRDLTDATASKLYVEQPGVSVTRASHLAVAKYIKSLFRYQATSELEIRARRMKGTSVHNGRKVMTLLQTMVDSTFYAAMQVTFDAANVPLDFNDERFIKTLYDPKMVDYVAAFYNQSFALSRHTVTAKRTILFDLNISAIRETLKKYTPPGLSAGAQSSAVIKQEQYSDEEEEDYQEYQGEAYIEDF